MKRIILTLALLVSLFAGAQTKAPMAAKAQPRTEQVAKSKTQGVPNGLKYPTKDGKRLPVMVGAKGGWYVERVSAKTGKPYRMYLNDKQKAKCVK